MRMPPLRLVYLNARSLAAGTVLWEIRRCDLLGRLEGGHWK